MSESTQHEREIRAARNQALFRVVNERLRELNESLSALSESFVIACEFANRSCVEMLTIHADEYEAMRAEPRHFAVRPDHVYPDVEDVVRESDEYVVVEKRAVAAQVAEVLDERR